MRRSVQHCSVCSFAFSAQLKTFSRQVLENFGVDCCLLIATEWRQYSAIISINAASTFVTVKVKTKTSWAAQMNGIWHQLCFNCFQKSIASPALSGWKNGQAINSSIRIVLLRVSWTPLRRKWDEAAEAIIFALTCAGCVFLSAAKFQRVLERVWGEPVSFTAGDYRGVLAHFQCFFDTRFTTQ